MIKENDSLWKHSWYCCGDGDKRIPFLCDFIGKEVVWGDRGAGEQNFQKENAKNAKGFTGGIKFFRDDSNSGKNSCKTAHPSMDLCRLSVVVAPLI